MNIRQIGRKFLINNTFLEIIFLTSSGSNILSKMKTCLCIRCYRSDPMKKIQILTNGYIIAKMLYVVKPYEYLLGQTMVPTSNVLSVGSKTGLLFSTARANLDRRRDFFRPFEFSISSCCNVSSELREISCCPLPYAMLKYCVSRKL